jgi:hypothetical protein
VDLVQGMEVWTWFRAWRCGLGSGHEGVDLVQGMKVWPWFRA